MAFPAPSDPKLTCRCGRWNNKIHCPGCGGYAILALGTKHNQDILLPNGERLTVPSFKCRRCAIHFNDVQWKYHCEAPRFETESMARRRAVENATAKVKDAQADIMLTAVSRGASAEDASALSRLYFGLKNWGPSRLNEDQKELFRKYGFGDLLKEDTVQ